MVYSRVHGLCATDTTRRRHRGVVAAPTSQHALPLLGCGHRARQHKHKLHLDHTPAGAWPEPADAVGVVEVARGEDGPRAKGRVPLEQAKPAPSEYPHATALGKFAAPRQNPHVLPPGFGVDPPEGWVDWVWLLGYERGCAKEISVRNSLSMKKGGTESSAFTVTNRRNKRLNLSRS